MYTIYKSVWGYCQPNMVGSKEIILRYYLEKSRRKSEQIKLGKRKLNCDFFGLGSLILQNVLEIPFCHAVQDPGQKPVANNNTLLEAFPIVTLFVLWNRFPRNILSAISHNILQMWQFFWQMILTCFLQLKSKKTNFKNFDKILLTVTLKIAVMENVCCGDTLKKMCLWSDLGAQ